MSTTYRFTDAAAHGRFMNEARVSIGTYDANYEAGSADPEKPVRVTFGNRPKDEQLVLDELAKKHGGEAEVA